MKDLISRLRRLGAGVDTSCLGLWITAFLLLKDRLFTETLAENVLTNLTCLTFFGGLVVAIFVGALAGNFLRRTFWKILIKRKK